MQKFIDWLTNVLAPKAQKFFNKPYIAGVSSAMTKVLPFILAGSIVYVYGVMTEDDAAAREVEYHVVDDIYDFMDGLLAEASGSSEGETTDKT